MNTVPCQCFRNSVREKKNNRIVKESQFLGRKRKKTELSVNSTESLLIIEIVYDKHDLNHPLLPVINRR